MLDGSRASADSLELEKGVADQRERKCVSAGLPETATDSTCIQGAFCQETCEAYLTWTGFAETKHGTSPDRPNAENREFLNRSIDRTAAKIGTFWSNFAEPRIGSELV